MFIEMVPRALGVFHFQAYCPTAKSLFLVTFVLITITVMYIQDIKIQTDATQGDLAAHQPLY